MLPQVASGRDKPRLDMTNSRNMRLRHLIAKRKLLISETPWSTADLAPRHAPVYSKTKPMRAGWKWRSARAKTEGLHFILTAECNIGRDNWKAMLIVETEAGSSVVGRFEYHGSHPGLHTHGHCQRGGVETGGGSLDNLVRTPRNAAHHRRINGWTEKTFWEAAKRFFRIKADEGPLFKNAS